MYYIISEQKVLCFVQSQCCKSKSRFGLDAVRDSLSCYQERKTEKLLDFKSLMFSLWSWLLIELESPSWRSKKNI